MLAVLGGARGRRLLLVVIPVPTSALFLLWLGYLRGRHNEHVLLLGSLAFKEDLVAILIVLVAQPIFIGIPLAERGRRFLSGIQALLGILLGQRGLYLQISVLHVCYVELEWRRQTANFAQEEHLEFGNDLDVYRGVQLQQRHLIHGGDEP